MKIMQQRIKAATRTLRCSCVVFALSGLALLLPVAAQAATYMKANTATMNQTTDWTTGIVPTSADVASWQTGSVALSTNLAMTLGGNFSCLTMDIRSSGQTPVNNCLVINPDGNTLSLFSNSSNNDAGAISLVQQQMAVAINCPITLSQASGGAFFRIINASMSVGGSIGQSIAGLTLNKQGQGTLNLAGANSYTGATTIQNGGGILTLSGSGTLGAPGTGGVTLTSSSSGATLDLGGTIQTVGGKVDFGKGEVRNGTLINNATGTGGNSAFVKAGVVSANLQGAGNLYLDDNTHFLKLSGINSYSGSTIIQGGLLVATQPAALPNAGASGTITLNNNSSNANLILRAGAASGEWTQTDIAGLLANGSFTCAGTAFFGIDTTGGDFTYGNAIPNKANMALKKWGPNTLTLSGANLYPGATTIIAGTVKVDNAAGGSLAATSGLTFSGTGVFNYDTTSTSQSLGALTLSAGEGTVQLTRSADAALTFSSLAARTAGATANLSLSGGTPSAANGFNLTGAAAGFINQGTFFSGADFAYMDGTGTFVRAPVYGTDTDFETEGTITESKHVKLTSTPAAQASITLNTLNLAGNGVGFPLSGTLTLANNGLLKSGGGTVGTISGGNINVINNTSATTKELVVRTDSASDALTISSVVGTDAPARTGTTSTSSAIVTGLSSTADLSVGMTVVIGGNGTTRTISSINSASQITLNANSPVAGTPTLVFFSGTLTKSGAGTLTLSGANTLAGGVNLNAGRLNINSTTALGGGVPSSGTAIGRFTINEGTSIDNTSGSPLSMTYKYAMTWNGSFTFVGSNDLYFPDPSGNGNITIPNDITVTTATKDITLRTQSNFAQTVARLTKNGPGTLQIGSNGSNGINGGLAINEGVFAGYWVSGQPFQVFAGPVDLGDTTPSNTKDAILYIDRNSSHSAPITVRAGSSGTLAIQGLGAQVLNGPIQLNNTLTLASSGTDIGLFGVISGSGGLTIGNTKSFVVFGATKSLVNVGSVTLWRANNYSGSTVINSGTLKLGALASINSSPTVSIGAGATLDVSQIADFTLSSSTTLAAKGTGTTTGTTAARIQGVSGAAVNLGSQPINLTFTPTSGSGDTTHPSLLISQGNLALSGNTISVVNNGPTLGAGVYRLIQVTSATTTGAPNTAPVVVTGTGGLAPYSTALATVSSGNVILTVTTKSATSFSDLTLSQTISQGTPSVTLGGTISAAGPTYPANGETVRIAINGVTNSTTVDAVGAFSYAVATDALTTGGSPYTISYLYEGNETLWSALDTNTVLTVTAQSVPTITTWPTAAGITYGEALSASTLSGGSASVPGTFSFTASNTIPSSAGTYMASGTFTPDDTGSYSVVITPGAISVAVGTKSLTIDTPAVTSRTYNGLTNATITGTLTGVVAGDVGLVSLVGTGMFATPDVANGISVTAACTLEGTKAGNYTLSQPTGLTGNITAATLTVTANNKMRLPGAANPALTYTITGYQNGENAASAGVLGEPVLSTTADEFSPEGMYAITCAMGTLSGAPNYSYVLVNGSLFVVSQLTWNTSSGIWDINTTPNWTNAAVGAAKYVDPVPVLFNDTPSGVTPFTVTLSTTVNPGGMTVNNSTRDYIFTGSSISGTNGLAKLGGGSLTLSSANTFSGGVTANGGTLVIANQNALGSGTLTMAGGIILRQDVFEGNSALGAITNTVNLSGGNVNIPLSFGGAKDIWLSGTITGGGGITLSGDTRALTLVGNNSFSGGVLFQDSNSRLVISHTNSLGTGVLRSEKTTPGSGTLENSADLSAGNGVPNPIDIPPGSYLNLNVSNPLKLSGSFTNAGGLHKTGSATLTLSGVNTYEGSYTGRTTVAQGTLSLSNKHALSGKADLRIEAGATVNLNYQGTMYISALTVNGVPQPVGVYGAFNLPAYFTGGGLLNTGKPIRGTLITFR